MKKYLPIFIIWLIGFFLRTYRQGDLLGFYYDQGRDAIIASDIISFKNFPAIGPTTGISGLYLGPFWFYLITPGYFFGGGNPATASYFIAFLESLTIPLIYFLLNKYWNNKSAYLAAGLWAFSHYLIRSARWFSNPSPLPLFVLLIFLVLTTITKEKKYKYLPLLALLFGLSLQLEAASAVFFLPVILFYFLINFKAIKPIPARFWLLSLFAFGVLLLPQLAFEIKNKFLISRNFIGFITGRINSDTGKSWAVPGFDFLVKRLQTYYSSFFSKLDTNLTPYSIAFLILFLIGCLYLFYNHRRHHLISLLLLWLFIPLGFLLFFVGNYGTLYDYYLTGFFPAFIILFAIIVTLPSTKFIYFTLAIAFIYFINGNFIHLKNYLIAGLDGPFHITLGNQLAAVDSACQENDQTLGNIDFYVPPVIPYTYEYLISWQQQQKLCNTFDSNRNNTVYIIYEVDPPHPERLSNWLNKYKNDQILDDKHFGGVVFQKLLRANL